MAKKQETVQIIVRNLWPFLLLAKLMGLLPWKIKGERITPDGYIGRIHCVACIAAYVAVEMCKVWANFKFDVSILSSTNVGKIFAKSAKSTNIVIVVVHMIRECVKPQVGIKIVENLKLYDRKIEQLGRAKCHRFLSYWIFMIPLLPFPVLLFEISTQPSEEQTSPEWNTMERLYNCCQVFMSFIVYLTALKVAGMTYLLYQRYRYLNEGVATNTSTKENSRLPAVTMYDLQYLHATLGRSVRMLTSTYSFDIFVWCYSLIWTPNYPGIKARWYFGNGLLNECDVLYAGMQAVCVCWVIHATTIEERIHAAMYFSNNRISFCAANICPINLSTLLFVSSMTLNFIFLLEEKFEVSTFSNVPHGSKG